MNYTSKRPVYRYRYPWRWALLAELFWRIEHLPLNYEGQVFAPLSRWGYRMRKACEHRGVAKRLSQQSLFAQSETTATVDG